VCSLFKDDISKLDYIPSNKLMAMKESGGAEENNEIH
jgi:hypothetical protein